MEKVWVPGYIIPYKLLCVGNICKGFCIVIVVFVVVYFILSRLLYLVLSANLGLVCLLHPGMGSLVYCPLQRMAE